MPETGDCQNIHFVFEVNMHLAFSELSWQLSWEDPVDHSKHTVPAAVPGNVIGDLHRAGIIQDPYFGCSSLALRKYEFADWEYSTVFSLDRIPGEELRLVFEGIDTVADIFLNDEWIGHTENMFISHAFSVTPGQLRVGENTLTVKIKSSVNFARNKENPAACFTLPQCFEGLHIRRAISTYGWDIAPRIVGAGLWRGGYLETLKKDRWGEFYLATIRVQKNEAQLALAWNCHLTDTILDDLSAKLTMTCGSSVFTHTFPVRFTSGRELFNVPSPLLWSPRGSGTPHLYTCCLELFRKEELLDSAQWRAGIRTIDLKRTETLAPDGTGEFVFIVNNKPVFIKGSNWVPANALQGEAPERVLKSLDLFAEAGCNMVRCWGGGVYEDTPFFDRCDELGLMVWQDFMFACETVPQEEAFFEKVRVEAESVVKKLRNHPSLALYSGDNECDDLLGRGYLKKRPMSTNKVTRRILAEAVYMNDPVRDYLPSSPYRSDQILHLPEDPCPMPEQHLWGPRDSWKNPFYKHNNAIFASEIGYHGMPCVESVRKFIPEKELNDRYGQSWLLHSTQPFADENGPHAYRTKLMEDQTREFFGTLPEDLETFAFCSQAAQAEAMKYFIEIFRAAKPAKTGLIWWNIIDCWPQFSDAVVDYFYQKKLAFHYIKTAQQPLSLLLSDPEGWSAVLSAANDTPQAENGSWVVSDIESGEIFGSGTYTVGAETTEVIARLPLCASDKRMLLISWTSSAGRQYNHYLLGNAPFAPEQYRKWLTLLQEKTGIGR